MRSKCESRPRIRRVPATTSLLLLVFAALLPTALVADCVTTLEEITVGQDDAINSAPSLAEGVLIPQTFTICPGTTMTVGNELKDTLLFRKSNVYIGCGSPSSIDNDCVITGMGAIEGSTGTAYIQTYTAPYNKGDFRQTVIQNITVEDITFTGFNRAGASPLTIVRQSEGMLFRRCTWKNNLRATNIADIYSPDFSVSKGMEASFEDCNFVDNVLDRGVIFNGVQNVTVHRCLFERNDISQFLGGGTPGNETDPVPYSSVIDGYLGDLTVTDSCFKDNIVHLATITSEDNIETFDGNYGSNNSRVTPDETYYNLTEGCKDILRTTDGTTLFPDFWKAKYECEEFDSGTCKAPTPSPTQMPSSSPEPTSDPSSGTCITSRAQSFLVVVTFWIGLVAF